MIDRKRLNRALIAGGVLAAIGIVLFLVLYSTLNEMDFTPRLFIALCIPPALIALIMGIVTLFVRRSQ
jgi:hypothetical protein